MVMDKEQIRQMFSRLNSAPLDNVHKIIYLGQSLIDNWKLSGIILAK